MFDSRLGEVLMATGTLRAPLVDERAVAALAEASTDVATAWSRFLKFARVLLIIRAPWCLPRAALGRHSLVGKSLAYTSRRTRRISPSTLASAGGGSGI